MYKSSFLELGDPVIARYSNFHILAHSSPNLSNSLYKILFLVCIFFMLPFPSISPFEIPRSSFPYLPPLKVLALLWVPVSLTYPLLIPYPLTYSPLSLPATSSSLRVTGTHRSPVVEVSVFQG